MVRTQATLARVAQIKTLVGRRIQASAARHRHQRRLDAKRQQVLAGVQPFQFQPYLDTSLRSSAVLLPLSVFLRLSPDTAPADHCHGHRSKATIVIVVSKQFDRVRVEQNHCQGLSTVTINCPSSILVPRSQTVPQTYRCPSPARIFSVYASRQFPRVEIANCRQNGLRRLGPGDQEFCARRVGETKAGGEKVGDFVYPSKEERVQRGSKLVIPFLNATRLASVQ